MNNKKSIKLRVRGWFPQEPACASPFTTQASQQPPRRGNIVYVVTFAAVCMAVFLAMGAMQVLGLGIYGSFAAGAAGVLAFFVVSVLFNRQNNQGKPITEAQKSAAKIIALVNLVMVGFFLGTYILINPHMPTVELTLGLWIGLLSLMFLVNNLLYRHFKKQNGFMKGI